MQINDKTPEPPPEKDPAAVEKLLMGLDLELNQQRMQRASGGGNRNLFRVLALVVILGGAMLALYILSAMLADLPRPAHSPTPAPTLEP